LLAPEDVSKSAVTITQFTVEDKRLIKGLWVCKEYGRKRYACWKYFRQKTKTDENKKLSCRRQTRAMLCVIKYFAKSLKVTQGHWKWYHSKPGYSFLSHSIVS